MAANEFKFFNIGKANAEITRLEQENQKLQSDLKAAQENSVAIEKRAEELQGEATKKDSDLKAANEQVTKLTSELSAKAEEVKSKETELTKVKGELKTAQDTIAEPSGQIQTAAAAKAAQITAAQGQPPVVASTHTNPAEKSKDNASGLTGISKVQAAFKAQLDKRA